MRRRWALAGLATLLLLGACKPADEASRGPGREAAGPEAGTGGPERAPAGAPKVSARADDWPSSRADLLNSGLSGSPTDAREGRLSWEWRAGGSVTQTPISDGRLVFVGDWNARFHALDLRTGELVWSSRPRRVNNANRELPDEGANLLEVVTPKENDDRYDHSAAAIAGDLVLACTQYGVLTAYDRANGEIVWEREIGADVHSSLRVARDMVLLGDADGAFRGFDLADGEERFRYETDDMLGSTCAVLSDGLAVFPGHDRRLHMVDIATGKARAVYDLNFRSTSTPLVAFGCAYLLTSASRIVAIDLLDGHQRWMQGGSGVTSNGFARFGNLVIAHISRQLRAWDGITGVPAWQIDLKGSGAISPAVGPELVYVVDDAGWAHAIDPTRGEHVWKLRFGEMAAASPILVGGLLICADREGRIFAYE